MASGGPIYVIQHNHLDPIWRRCWDRSFDYKGNRYRGYAELEERFISSWLDSARRGATVTEGQAAVIRAFIERNPGRFQELLDLVTRGIFELTCAGETVADTNLPSGETLLRNLAMGQWYFRDTFGVTGSIGWVEDAFGQSAQLPQLFRGVGCRLLLKRSYKAVPGDYWRGLDGSVICVKDAPFALVIGHASKMPPCPSCRGMGCRACDDSGLDESTCRISDEDLSAIATTDFSPYPYSLVTIGGEEAVPNRSLPEIVERIAEATGLDLRFGTFADVARHLADALEKVDSTDVAPSSEVEANPVSTGCYTSRIALKQEFRRVENLVNVAERWASVAWLLGDDYPHNQLTSAWRDLLFCAFHDAITCTHVDAAYAELMEMLSAARTGADAVLGQALDGISGRAQFDSSDPRLLLFNSESWERSDPVTVRFDGQTGVPSFVDEHGEEAAVLDARVDERCLCVTLRPPSVPPLGYVALRIVPDQAPVHAGEDDRGPGTIENEFYRISVAEHGIVSLFDKRSGREILDTSRYLLNELILEEDIGHPWGTMQPPAFTERLSGYTTGVSIRRTGHLSQVSLTGIYKGTDPNTLLLSWRQSLTLHAAYDRIDLKTTVDWDTRQRRLRVAIPTSIHVNAGVYSVPYGAVRRGDYTPEMDRMPSTNGDWPAVNWIDVYSEDEDRGCALINTGTPSHKIEHGVIFMSLLRSPTDSWCLNEPEYYDCPDFDGARDAGHHEFSYALIPHDGDTRAARIEQRALEVNRPLQYRVAVPAKNGGLKPTRSFLQISAPDHVVVSAMKKAERGDQLIVRLAETAGVAAEATIAVEGIVALPVPVDYLEQPIGSPTRHIELGPFKVTTVAFDVQR